jgi:hypothetical protein
VFHELGRQRLNDEPKAHQKGTKASQKGEKSGCGLEQKALMEPFSPVSHVNELGRQRLNDEQKRVGKEAKQEWTNQYQKLRVDFDIGLLTLACPFCARWAHYTFITPYFRSSYQYSCVPSHKDGRK